MTTSTSALSKFSTSWRADGRAAAGAGASTPGDDGRPASGGLGAAAVDGGTGGGEDGGAGTAGGAGGRGMGAGSVVTSTRGRPASPGWLAAVGAPDGGTAEAQPAPSARTTNQHVTRLQTLIAARLAWRARGPPRPAPGAAGSPDSRGRGPSGRRP